LLVMGGSMGALALNEMAVSLAERLTGWNVVNLYGRSPVACARPNYIGVPFAEHVADYYARADVVLCRSGANTLFELAALNKPTVTVPLPKGTSRGDQAENAAYFSAKYGFAVFEQSSATADALADAVLDALRQAPSSSGVSSPNAAIARYVYEVFRGSRHD